MRAVCRQCGAPVENARMCCSAKCERDWDQEQGFGKDYPTSTMQIGFDKGLTERRRETRASGITPRKR